MYFGISGPLSECLSIVPEDDAGATEEGNQTHVGHDGWDVSRLDDPWSNELGESITPDVLVHRDGNKYRSGNRFV